LVVKTRALVAGLALFLLVVTVVFAVADGSLIATFGVPSPDAPGERLVQDGILIWHEVLIAYEPVLNTYRVTTTCGITNVSCVPQSWNQTNVSSTEHGPPVYERTEVTASNVSGILVQRHQENVGCFVCPTNLSVQVCYGYDDGFSDNLAPEWQCECKSGTSCKKLTVADNATLYYHTDGEFI